MINIVLLPGMDGTGKMFTPLIERLPKPWNICVVSYPSDQALGYDQLTEEASKYIPLEGDYFLLGESFSGPIAISLASTADSRLKGVILCCSFMRSPIRVFRYFVRLLGNYPVSLIPKYLIEMFLFGRYRSESLSRLLNKALNGVSNKTFSKRLLNILDVNVSDPLGQLKVPITYLRATEDRLVGPKESMIMSQVVEQMTIVDLSGPHCLLQASPGEAAEKIAQFVQNYGGSYGSNQ